jgi:hypothetical protein
MFQRLCFPLALALVLVLLSGCTLGRLWPWKKPPRAIAKTDLLIGTVAVVNEEASFALIDNGTLPAPSAGTVLKVKTAGGAIVELRATAIRRPPFVVADIVKGMPKKGDEVFQ